MLKYTKVTKIVINVNVKYLLNTLLIMLSTYPFSFSNSNIINNKSTSFIFFR